MIARVRTTIVILLTAAGLLAAGAPAGAYSLGGQAWNKRTIKVDSALGAKHEPAVRAALRAWSTSGVRIRLVRVRRGGDLHILPGTARTIPGGAAGFAPIGMQPNRRIRILSSANSKPNGLDYTFARIITHELGHAIGLGHSNRRCATMSPLVPNAPDCMKTTHFHEGGVGSFCRLLQADDIRGAVKRYGGRVRLAPLVCYRTPAPARPTLAPAPSGDGQGMATHLTLLWTAPTDYPARDRSHLTPVTTAAAGRCPGTRPKETNGYWSGPDGDATRTLSVEVPSGGPRYGRFCVTVWTLDDAGRVSPPASIWIERPAPAPSVEVGCYQEDYAGLTVSCWVYAYDRDPAPATAPIAATIDWGDGTPATKLDGDAASGASTGHTYPAAGAFTVTVTARTGAGAQGTATTTVTLEPAADG